MHISVATALQNVRTTDPCIELLHVYFVANQFCSVKDLKCEGGESLCYDCDGENECY